MIKFDFDKNNINVDNENLGTVNICQNILYYHKQNDILYEINDDLCVIDSNNCFWHTIEYELKIDLKQEIKMFNLIVNESKEKYSISTLTYQKTFETHYLINKSNEDFKVVVLGKKNWIKKKAIKIKTNYDCIGRRVSILPYNEDTWNLLTDNSISIIKYPFFYKNKYRYILVNKETGSVFGLSYSYTNFLNKKYQNKNEIEIEYWSNILPKSTNHRFNQENKQELNLIMDNIIKVLEKNNINYVYPGVRKSEWFKEIYK